MLSAKALKQIKNKFIKLDYKLRENTDTAHLNLIEKLFNKYHLSFSVKLLDKYYEALLEDKLQGYINPKSKSSIYRCKIIKGLNKMIGNSL